MAEMRARARPKFNSFDSLRPGMFGPRPFQRERKASDGSGCFTSEEEAHSAETRSQASSGSGGSDGDSRPGGSAGFTRERIIPIQIEGDDEVDLGGLGDQQPQPPPRQNRKFGRRETVDTPAMKRIVEEVPRDVRAQSCPPQPSPSATPPPNEDRSKFVSKVNLAPLNVDAARQVQREEQQLQQQPQEVVRETSQQQFQPGGFLRRPQQQQGPHYQKPNYFNSSPKPFSPEPRPFQSAPSFPQRGNLRPPQTNGVPQPPQPRPQGPQGEVHQNLFQPPIPQTNGMDPAQRTAQPPKVPPKPKPSSEPIPAPAPTQDLHPEDFNRQPETSSSSTQPPQAPKSAKQLAMEKIQAVTNDVAPFAEQVEHFQGQRGDKEYLYLDEMLTRQLIRLDVVETGGDDEVRAARKDTIMRIQNSLMCLERRCGQQPDGLDAQENGGEAADSTEPVVCHSPVKSAVFSGGKQALPQDQPNGVPRDQS